MRKVRTDDRLLGLTGGVGDDPRYDKGVTTEQESHEVVTTESDRSVEGVGETLDVDHRATDDDLIMSFERERSIEVKLTKTMSPARIADLSLSFAAAQHPKRIAIVWRAPNGMLRRVVTNLSNPNPLMTT
jgi:hypothetical protein